MGGEKSSVFSICQSNESLISPESYPNIRHLFSTDVFKSALQQLHAKSKLSIDEMGLFKECVWDDIFASVEGYYLNSNQKAEFISLIDSLIDVNFGGKDSGNEAAFSKQIGKKLHTFDNRLFSKHKQCLEYCEFEREDNENHFNAEENHFPNLDFDLTPTLKYEPLTVARKVREFCKNDFDAFAYLTLYIVHCMNEEFTLDNPIQDRQAWLARCLEILAQNFPANTNNSANTQTSNFGIKDIKNGTYQNFAFAQNGQTHMSQLKFFVIQKAQQAKEDLPLFIQLTKPICLNRGYGFKYGTKIKDQSHTPAIMRTIEKLLDKPKFEKQFDNLRKNCLQNQMKIEKKHNNNLQNFVEWEKQQVSAKILEILQTQKTLEFDSKDLLRGKCLFDKTQDIASTVKQLQQKIIQKGYKLYQLKNRLNKNTKDITLIIKLPNSVAQLQLALKFDTALNEFNHRIYELIRSKMYSPITNLYVLNERWSSDFFNEKQKMTKFAAKEFPKKNFGFSTTFGDAVAKTEPFWNTFLMTDFMKIEFKEEDPIASQKPIKQIEKIEQKVCKGYDSGILAEKRKVNRYSNSCSFYYNSNQIQKASKLLEDWKAKGQKDDNMLQLGGQIKMKEGKDQESLNYFLECLQIKQKYSSSDSFESANILRSIGVCYDNMGKYQEALTYLQRSKAAYLKKVKADDPEMIYVNSSIGHVYYNQGNYSKAISLYEESLKISGRHYGKENSHNIQSLENLANLYRIKDDYKKSIEYHERCLRITEKEEGRQSSEYANIINNIGLAYLCQNDVQKAVQCYQQSLQIQQRIFGPNSINCATTYNNLGHAYLSNRNIFGKVDSKKAMEHFSKALPIYQQIKGNESQQVAMVLVNIGQSYREQNNYSKALEHFEKALKIYQSIKGQNSIDCAPVLMNIGLVYNSQKNNQKALEHYQKALDIQKKVKGQKSIDVSTTYINLALLVEDMGDDNKSLQYAQECYQIRKQILGDLHPKTKNAKQQVDYIKQKTKTKHL